jgi:hypothetical protein
VRATICLVMLLAACGDDSLCCDTSCDRKIHCPSGYHVYAVADVWCACEPPGPDMFGVDLLPQCSTEPPFACTRNSDCREPQICCGNRAGSVCSGGFCNEERSPCDAEPFWPICADAFTCAAIYCCPSSGGPKFCTDQPYSGCEYNFSGKSPGQYCSADNDCINSPLNRGMPVKCVNGACVFQ